MDFFTLNSEFEKKLNKLGFSYRCHTDDFYILSKNNDTEHILSALLKCSEPVDDLALGSRNGNVIQSIGHFKLRLPTEITEIDFAILAFQNTNNHCVEFIIIPPKELKRRLVVRNRDSTDNREIEMVFWLMPDRQLYETTDISIEAEWYYFSKGVRGRMADQSEWDYTEFLNDWNRIKMA